MKNSVPKEIEFKFVQMGAVAPKFIPDSEIWIDVGNRADRQIYDHHNNDTQAWSASQLILEEFERFLQEPFKSLKKIILVLHDNPDLDAICGAWLICEIFSNQNLPEPLAAIEEIIEAVSENDQGMVKTSEPDKCWPIIIRTLINTEYANLDNRTKVKEGMKTIHKTFSALAKGIPLSSISYRIITPSVKIVITHAKRDYAEDLSRSLGFQVRLPANSFKSLKDKWISSDAIFLENPTSRLFKELARSDEINSPRKQGFSLMIVSNDLKIATDFPLKRHIISTDPLSGLNLHGLGSKLEDLEQKKEEKNSIPLLPGRERVKSGEGRFGYNVKSPWYDGRGHNYSIIDSPSVVINNLNECASHLSSDEVLEAVWEYSDPARFVEILESDLTLIFPARLPQDLKSDHLTQQNFSDSCPDLYHEVKASISNFGIEPIYNVRISPDLNSKLQNKISLLQQKIWPLSKEIALWMGRFKFNQKINNLKDISLALHDLRKLNLKDIISKGTNLILKEDPIHILHCRLKHQYIDLEDNSGPSSQIFYRLANAEKSKLHNVKDKEELLAINKIFSRDRRNMVYPTSKGMVVLSTRALPFDKEKDFHKPDPFTHLVALISAQQYLLHHMSAQFISHQSLKNQIKAGNLILKDRMNMFQFEQALYFSRISDRKFGQRTYEALSKVMGIHEIFQETRNRIETLAD